MSNTHIVFDIYRNEYRKLDLKISAKLKRLVQNGKVSSDTDLTLNIRASVIRKFWPADICLQAPLACCHLVIGVVDTKPSSTVDKNSGYPQSEKIEA